MIKLMLNLHKFNNYAFFCPVSRLHLTVSNPVGYANEVTTAILKALKTKTILDVNGVIDIETGTVKTSNQKASTPEEQKPVQEKETEQKSSESKSENDGKAKEDSVDKIKEEKPKTEEKPKRGKRAAAVDEQLQNK